ncbi:MAG: hypothetical protein HPY66_0651 [Firmicutes bacterium]|nr:hypothetical protein [Bacillota bacterium]
MAPNIVIGENRGHSSRPRVIYWGHSAARNTRIAAVCPLADIWEVCPHTLKEGN